MDAVYSAAADDFSICLFEGGQFIWPPSSVGSTRDVDLPGMITCGITCCIIIKLLS